MADISDLERAIVTQAALALFPTTPPYQPGTVAVSSVTGVILKVYRGWPLEVALDADLLKGITHVSVFPSPGMARLTSRYFRKFVYFDPAPATFTVATSGQTVTFGGIAGPGQVLGVGWPKVGYTVRLASTDTPAALATEFAAHLPGTTASGSTITLSTVLPITATVLADTPQNLETRRQEQVIRVSVWAPDPATRDTVSSAIDSYMSNVRTLAFPDGSFSGPPLSHGTHIDDVPQKAKLWVRHLSYGIDYPTILQSLAPRAIFIGGENLTNGFDVGFNTQLQP